MTPELSVQSGGRPDLAADVILTGPRGGIRYVATLPEASLRDLAFNATCQADLIRAFAEHRPAVACVCTNGAHRDDNVSGWLRCGGTGSVNWNLGYCTGCRSNEHGTYAASHRPEGSSCWPTSWS